MNDRIEKRVEVKAPVERIWRAPADHRESGEWLQVRLDGSCNSAEARRERCLASVELASLPWGVPLQGLWPGS
jgi:hypothetical protein